MPKLYVRHEDQISKANFGESFDHDSSDHSGNWSQKFILGVAGQVTGFVFNVIIAVLGIIYHFRSIRNSKDGRSQRRLKFYKSWNECSFLPLQIWRNLDYLKDGKCCLSIA